MNVSQGPDSLPDAERKTVLILGGTSDIGMEIIRQLAPQRPLILAHGHQSLAKVQSLAALHPGPTIVPIRANLAYAEEVDAMLDDLDRRFPLPNQFVHLPAPKFEYVRFKEAHWDQFQQELNVQVRSFFQVAHHLLPAMAHRKSGKVVAVLSSVTMNVPPAALAHYVTAKYALWGLVRALAAEYSSRHLNINAVSPSMVETAFLEKLPQRMVEIAAAQSPRGRNARPADVAAVVRFLLSSEADFMTGANLPVTGGSTF